MASPHNPMRVFRGLGAFLLPVFGCVLAINIWTGPLSVTASALADDSKEGQTEPAVIQPGAEVATAEEAAKIKAAEVKAAADKAAADAKAAGDRAAADKAAAEAMAAEAQAAADKAAAEKAAAQAKAAKATAAADKAAADKAASEAKAAEAKAAADRAAADRAAAEAKAAADKAAADKTIKDRAAQDKAERDKAAEALGGDGRERIAIFCMISLLALTHITACAFLKSIIGNPVPSNDDTPAKKIWMKGWERLAGGVFIVLGVLVFVAWFLTSLQDPASKGVWWWFGARESWFANITLPEVTLLIAATFGSLGGVLYTMLDNKLTFPRYDRNLREVELGYLVDCAYGWGGAFATFLVLPKDLLSINDGLMKVIGTAVVAGYGGRAIIAQALGTLTDRVNKVEGTFANEDVALKLAREQMEGKEVPADDLVKAIKKSSALGRTTIFNEVEDFLKQYEDVPARVVRTLPILTALTKSDEQRQLHRYHAALGSALLKAKEAPDYEVAMHAFQEAIEIRKKEDAAADGTYELGFAVCRIRVDPDKVEEIKKDLKVALNDDVVKQRFEKEVEDADIQAIRKWATDKSVPLQEVGLEALAA